MIHYIFERIVEKYPNNIAITHNDKSISYENLNIRSNKLAHALIEKGISNDDTVAIIHERSIEYIVYILAVLKAGGAYIPLEPDLPAERIRKILFDSKPKYVIAERTNSISSLIDDIKVMCADGDYNSYCGKNPVMKMEPSNLCSIIYTSGSTGNPKGVMLEHKNIASLLTSLNFGVGSNDVCLLFHSFCFDFSLFELFMALTTGGKVVIASNKERYNPRELASLITQNNITVLSQTPSSFNNLLNANKNLDFLSHLKYLILGGETLNFRDLNRIKNGNLKFDIINIYGPTETTVFVSYKLLSDLDIDAGIQNIGKNLPHTNIYLLDEDLRPTNNKGEIYIEGDAVARGYINNESLTKMKFIQSPFAPNKKMYKTGDWAFQLPNKDFVFLGRVDQQVKLHGYRVELAEIESAVNMCIDITRAVVIPQKTEEGVILVTLYSTQSGNPLADNYIKTAIAEVLPMYMIPKVFIHSNDFPLNINGKLAREYAEHLINNITKPSHVYANNEFISDCKTNKILTIISQSLEIDLVNITNDVLMSNLGFDSINYINMVISLEEEFDITFDNNLLYYESFNTVQSVIDYIGQKTKDKNKPL